MRLRAIWWYLVISGMSLLGCTLAGQTDELARYAPADKTDEPTADELSRASWVMEAKVAARLSDKEWLFREGYHLVSALLAPQPKSFVGWWEARRPNIDSPQLLIIAPAPRNAEALRLGQRFLITAERDFHLLGVYRVGFPRQNYVGDMTRATLEHRIFDARLVRGAATMWMKALSFGRWSDAATQYVTPSLRATIAAAPSPEMYFKQTGILDVAAYESPGLSINVLSLEDRAAKVEVVNLVPTKREKNHRYAAVLDFVGKSEGPWEISSVSAM